MNGNKNRWWEFYFVRYAMGTIVGAVIMLAIVTQASANSHILIWLQWPSLNQLNGSRLAVDVYYAIVYGALGLAFCYISSAPILVFYANRHIGPTINSHIEPTRYRHIGPTRYHYDGSRGKSWKPFFLPIIGFIYLVAFGVTLWTIPRYFPAMKTALHGSINKHLFITSSGVPTLQFLEAMALPLWTLIVMAVAVVSLMWTSKDGEAYSYYKKVTMQRAWRSGWRPEMVETYRHLREHGNSFAILVFEGVFGIGLYATSQLGHWAGIGMLAYIVIWAMPAVFVWVFALNLEWNFSEDTSDPQK